MAKNQEKYKRQCNMVSKIYLTSILGFICLLTVPVLAVSSGSESESDKKEYQNDLARITSFHKVFNKNAVGKSLNERAAQNLEEYEKLGDEIERKWEAKDNESHARLMVKLCEPLASGTFNDRRQYALSRKYALSGLAKPNEIPLETELRLADYVTANLYLSTGTRGKDWQDARKTDVEVRFHAWKRLADAIDPNWDQNEEIFLHPLPPKGLKNYVSGASPKTIKDPVLRSEYEKAIIENDKKIQRFNEQLDYRKRMELFSETMSRYAIYAYSAPPYNTDELNDLLKKYITDKSLNAKISEGVATEMAKREQKEKEARASGLKKVGEINKAKYKRVDVSPIPKTK